MSVKSENQTKHSRRGEWLWLLLIPAVLLLFWPVLLHPFSILHPTFSRFSDTMVIHWPKAWLMAQSWQNGHGLPHWTPVILSGMPLAMLSYPPGWLFLIFPIEPTFNVLFIFHLLLGSLGIYFLLRENYRLSPAAALLGGLTFALNGKWLAHAAGGHVSMVGAVGWMPWTLLGVMMLLNEVARGRESEKARSLHRAIGWALLVAVSLAMQIVTHTLPLIYSTYLVGAMVLFYQGAGGKVQSLEFGVQSSEVEGRWRRFSLGEFVLVIVLLGGAFLLAALLGAGQLLPLLELAPYSNRSLTLAQAAEYSVTPTQLLVGLLLPSAQGGHEYVIYLGLVPLLFIPFSLSRKNRWSWFYGGVLLFAVLFALGPVTPIHRLFYEIVPGFGWVRTPARMFFVGTIAISVLVGFAVERLNTVKWSPKAKRWITRLAIIGGLLALLAGVGLAVTVAAVRQPALALAIFVPATLILITLRIQMVLSTRWFSILMGLVLVLDLALFDISMMRFVPLDEALEPGRPAAEYLAGQPGLFRVYSPSYSLPMQTAAAHNLQLADGVEPVHLAAYDEFMARAGGYNQSGFSVTIPHFGEGDLETLLRDVEPDFKLLGLLNVQYIASAFPMAWTGVSPETTVGSTYIYTNQHTLPRARVVHQTIPTEQDWLAQLEALPNLADVAIVETGSQLTGSDQPATAATVTHYSADLIEVETDISAPGWLVLSEIWYPGWQATVNGTVQPVDRVNGFLRGVYLPEAGRQSIVLEYRPNSVVWGNRIAGAAVVLVAVLLASIRFYKKEWPFLTRYW